MKQELQDKAWRVLPAEFREEVKICYQYAYVQYGKSDLHRGSANAIESLFGHHNLTSDAEGEELLTVSAITVREMYAANERIKNDASDNELGRISDHINHVLRCLFGSKCLPDIEPKPAEPKFKIGDKVRISCAFSSGEIWDSVLNGRVATIVGCYRESNNWIYCFEEPIRDFAEFWLEPCTGQETLHCPSSETECYIPVRVPKMDEQRLNIATHITAAIYANYDVAKCFESIEAIVRKAVETADALIAGCKKE